MKRKQTNQAEISKIVREAQKNRAEADIADIHALKIELQRERRALERTRKEKLSTFLYGLATFFLTSTGIGGLSPIIFNTGKEVNWPFVALGFIASLLSMLIANNTLKYKDNG